MKRIRSKVSSRTSSDELPPPNRLGQRRADPIATGIDGAVVGLEDHDVETGASRDLGDARAHQTATDDPDLREVGAGVHWLGHIRPRRKLTAGVAAGKVSVDPDAK